MTKKELQLKAAKEFSEYWELTNRGEYIDQDYFENLIERHTSQLQRELQGTMELASNLIVENQGLKAKLESEAE